MTGQGPSVYKAGKDQSGTASGKGEDRCPSVWSRFGHMSVVVFLGWLLG